MQSPSSYQLEVAESLWSFATTVINHLGYLHPNWILRIDTSAIIAEVPNEESEEAVAREIRYPLVHKP